MKAEPRFQKQPKHFWANVRSLGEEIGYSAKGRIRVPTLQEMRSALHRNGLESRHIVDDGGHPTELGIALSAYFQHRADLLNDVVEPRLMTAERARAEFERLREDLRPACPIPNNKQKNEKSGPAFFTGIINMLIEANSQGLPCDYGPRKLTKVTFNGAPLRTLARQVDGAFPRIVNPVAIWEIKEYYYTTTFGSRVADGVYETLLDGMELEELREHEGVDVLHYLMIDAHYTWWERGRSYLCRIVDMLHMGYVDEVLFGYEVIERLPAVVREWVEIELSKTSG